MLLENLYSGLFLSRRKRFFADVQLPSEIVVAHCPNTGSMATLLDHGSTAFISKSDNPKRKLGYTLEALQLANGTFACVNTQRANFQVAEALKNGVVQGIPSDSLIEQEVVLHQGTRFDFRITPPGQNPIWLEVKNVTLAVPQNPGMVAFPDAVTVRGTKHLTELTELQNQGIQTCICFLANRSDAQIFRPATEFDPTYAKALNAAKRAGVRILVLKVDFTLQNETRLNMEIHGEIPWQLS